MSDSHQPLPLKGVVQKYSWGKLGLESAVARLAEAYEKIDDGPFAGAHFL